MQDLLFDFDEVRGLRAQLKDKDRAIEAMQAAASGTREVRHQQSKLIEKQRAQILELERQVKKLDGLVGQTRKERDYLANSVMLLQANKEVP